MTCTQKRLLVIFLVSLCIAVLPGVSANVIVFDQYDTVATIDRDQIIVERQLRLKNTGQTPIIPGELHFRLYEQRGGTKVPIEVNDFTATSVRGETLSTTISTRGQETDLAIHIWNPLLPGFHYEFSMRYAMVFKPSGILFYEIVLPREETTIPITSEETQFRIDDRYYVTYASSGAVNKISGNTVVRWRNADEQRVVEYSRLPLPKVPFRAVNLFWSVIIVLLVGFFVLSLRRSKKTRGRGAQTVTHDSTGWQQWQGNNPPPGNR